MWIKNLACNGKEKDVSACNSDDWNIKSCSASCNIYVTCGKYHLGTLYFKFRNTMFDIKVGR